MSRDNIIHLVPPPVVRHEPSAEATAALTEMMMLNLSGVVILGVDQDGEEVMTSTLDNAETVWLLERAKYQMLGGE